MPTRSRTPALALAAAAALALSIPPALAVPPGFVVETVNSGLATPVSVAFAPDGRIFYNELQGGRVRIIENGVVVPTPFATLSVSTAGEKGLIGLALHPDFATNGFVYVCYSTPAGGHEIGRFTAVGNVGTAYTPIVPNLPGSGIHNGGNIAFGPDGKLYHSMGDNANSANSQSASVYPGKIHRFNDDGTIPADNPYTTGMLSRYCMGLRNSFDLTWNQTIGVLYASENGPGSDDEVNRIVAGGNFGWPTLMCSGNPSFLPALTCWTPTVAPTGIAAYEAAQFGAEYTNNLFVADFNGGTIWRIDMTDDGLSFQQRTVFHDESASVYDVIAGPDGNLYYTTGSQLRRIRRLVPVNPPTALSCSVQGEDVLLAWTNQGSGAGGAYESLQVRRDGAVIATLAGDLAQYVDPAPAGGAHTYDVRGLASGNQSGWVPCAVTVAVDPVTGFSCSQVGTAVQLDWTNAEDYDALILYRDGGVLLGLGSAAETYLDIAPPFGPVTYELVGSIGSEDSPAAICQTTVVASFVRGDCNVTGAIDIADAIRALDTLFGYQGPPGCPIACDMNDDGAFDIADPVSILAYLFSGGPGSPACVDGYSALGCGLYPHCP